MSLDFNRDYFALFGLQRAFKLEINALEQSYRAMQSEVHPDRFAHAGEQEKRLSMQWSSRINEAYRVLRNPMERANYLLQLRGVEALSAHDTSMPSDFLMQQMEWREMLEDARSGTDEAALAKLEKSLRSELKALEKMLGDALDNHADSVLAALTLRKMKFLNKLLAEVGEAFEELA
jgi:molecular chaperone HscB